MDVDGKVGARTYAGLFVVTLATLMEEILLTRIFSVTMWNHLVFMAVAVAMFGLTVGGLAVYLGPHYLPGMQSKRNLSVAIGLMAVATCGAAAFYAWVHLFSAALAVVLFGVVLASLAVYLAPQLHDPCEVGTLLSAAALVFAITTVVSFLVYLEIPPLFDLTAASILGFVTILAVISVPFVFSGVVVCLALTKFPRRVSQLYAADLTGAAAGCILIVYALRFVDAPTMVIFSAALAGLGAFLFAEGKQKSWLSERSLACAILVTGLGIANLFMASRHQSLLDVKWEYDSLSEPAIYERWNSFSRVVVSGNPNVSGWPSTWGLSPAYHVHALVRQLSVRIDSGAFTVMTHYDGDFHNLDYLRFDITNFAHYFRPDSRVVVIGVGGGRDVLSALAFGQKSVTGIEMNQAILNALNHVFGDFSGNLDRNPRVRFVNDEARSYLARMPQRVDIIQASLVDTWAATLAGTFALAENSLYTTEAWRMFLDHLTPRGILTFTRWYDPQYPAETYRLVALASAALARFGVENPRTHIILVMHPFFRADPGIPGGVATILVGREAFSSQDLDRLETLTGNMQFDILLSPRQSANPVYAGLTTRKGLEELGRTLPGRIKPPTDDSPFFLCDFDVGDLFLALLGRHAPNVRSTLFEQTFGALIVSMTLLTLLCFLVPWMLAGRKSWVPGSASLVFYFAAIGLGFMLVEVSQLQRFMIFLGHPTYSLSTVLFTLLLSSGLGSLSTGYLSSSAWQHWPVARLLGLLAGLALFGLLAPSAFSAFASSSTPVRIAITAALLFPAGFLMGMAFPLGMKVASSQCDALTPWLWGLNGATSVLASQATFLIVLGWGVSAAFWTGFVCYAVAIGSYVWTTYGRTPAAL